MRIKDRLLKVFILIIVLTFICIVSLVVFGRSYTIKTSKIQGIRSLDDVQIKIDNENNEDYEIIRISNVSLKNGEIEIPIVPVSQGRTTISVRVTNSDYSTLFNVYVHRFNIITVDTYFGKCNGAFAVRISMVILLLYILYLLIGSYKFHSSKSMYQYKNIYYLSMIIFTSISIINQLLTLYSSDSLDDTVQSMISLFLVFSMIALPIAFVVSILVIISNIMLARKEGLNLKIVLGMLLGIVLCFMTVLPDLIYSILHRTMIIDIFNEQGVWRYIYSLIENLIFVIVSYLECILLGSIIMSLKAARHIPKFDKDYIIILGCQIRKDGTLTNLLKGRVDRAIEFSKMQKEKANKDIVFVPSGGKGANEVCAEASAMKNYLLEKGIKEENILIEDKSTNTIENMNFSNKLIMEKNENAKIAFSTTNYHVFRAGAVANTLHIEAEGIGSKTKPYFWINAFIREFIATLYAERKKHIIAFLLILLALIQMISTLYISNVL